MFPSFPFAHGRRLPDSYRTLPAFSLVEVVLALGLMAFSLVALLGLIPLGMNSFRNASILTVEAQIVQSVASDLQLTDFSNLAASTTYYDHEGIAVTQSDPNRIYTVTATPQALLSPVGTFSATLSAKNVLIQIVNRTAPGTVSPYSVIVANNNR